MSIYQCLTQCKAENIDLVNWLVASHGTRKGDRFTISATDSEEEQIITLLHEVVHDYPEYRSRSRGWFNRDETVEARIEKEAQEIYQTRPRIVEYVRRQLRLAKDAPINRM